MNALQTQNLCKAFPGFQLDNLTLALPAGCILGLVGENGAGKSTFLRLVLDILHRDSGTVSLLGRDNRENLRLTKEDIGVVFDEVGLPTCLNTRQVDRVMSGIYAHWDSELFAHYLQSLSIPQGKPFGDFSRGNKMKLGIAIALSHGAKLLLLDEATNGLDPVVRDQVVELLMDFTRQADHSVLLSSHIVSDLEKLCDYIAFLHQGKLQLLEEKDVLLARYGLFRGAPDQLAALPQDAVVHRRTTPYSQEALVDRSKVPAGLALSPVSIEELFVYMNKEAM